MKATLFCWLTVPLLTLITLPTAFGAPRQVVRGLAPPAVSHLQAVERLGSTKRLELSIGLPLRNREALTNLLAQIYAPESPAYHQYLTAKQFAEQFGPTVQDYQAVIAWAKSKGLQVRGTHPNRTLVDVEASVAAIEKAFNLTMQVYKHPREARTFYAPDREPSLDLSVRVLAISGLDDFIVPRPMNLHTAFNEIPFSTPYGTGSGPNGSFLGRDFRAAYAPGLALDGAGQAVGLFELDGYYTSDVLAYESLAGLPNVPLTNVLVSGFSGRPGGNNIEVALDIDMVVSMAPGLSQVIVYEGRGNSPNSVLNRMATDNLAKQLSSSWGFGPQVDPIRQQIFQQFAAQGQSLFQASGDNGAWTGPIFPPSDDPFLTVVGGTALATTGPGGAWVSETVWSGSGGGISASYGLPGWQQGVSTAANQGSMTMRNIPDVACLADTIIWLVANNGQQFRVGGTSAAAPLWAGFAALANQQAAASGKPALGFINPALYALGSGSSYPAALHDIANGNNTNSLSPTNFFAVPGYDLCTGWGTPAGSNLISALLAPPDALRISPGTSFTSIGPVGGPFLPAVQSYSLTNTGANPLNWMLVNTPPWLDVSSSSGTLMPGGAAGTLTLNVNGAASNLVAGSYSATLWFTNLNDNFAQSRQFTLNVVTAPVITSPPANQAVFAGATATFTVGTVSNAFLAYQWQYDNGMYPTNLTDGGNVSGSASSTLTVTDASTANVGAYSVIVSNAAGAVSSASAFLTIVPWRPSITSPPASQTALPGSTATLSVAAVGSQPLFYHWLKSGTYLADGGNISGSATSSLVIRNVSSADAGTYSVIVGNALGLVSSPEATLTVPAVTAPGTALASLYLFSGGADGGHPNGLAQGTNGHFYGTTQTGGADSRGTLFQMTAVGELSSLRSFSGGNDGANPRAALLAGADGNFYGTTYQAGTNGFGTVFSATPGGALTTLFSFDKPDGILPYAGVVQGTDGNFYGTTYEGGTNQLYGTVYKLSPNGVATNLHSFTGGNDGGFPYAGLVQGADGNFYGTTYSGGTNKAGTVFRISADGTLTTLVSFNNTNGAFPYAGLVQGTDGNFYGATANGGSCSNGTLFRLAPAGTLTTLYSFTGTNDGANPVATLLEGSDGNFYGTTANGGVYASGTLFRLAPNGVFTTLAQFDGYNGANPVAPLTQGADGNLFGVTQNGGLDNQGTFFRLSMTTAPQITVQPAGQSVFVGATVRLSVAVAGSPLLSYQWLKNGTNLTDGGNLSGAAGRVLTLTNASLADTGAYSVLVSNTLGSVSSEQALLQVSASPPIIVQQPASQAVAPGTMVTFSVAAVGNLPLSYQWRRNGTNLTDSGNSSGGATSALSLTSVTEADNGRYSVNVSNILGSVTSAEAELLVVPISAAGTRLTSLRFFSGAADGLNPNGLMRALDGNLYGTTQVGGTSLNGMVFKVDTNGAVTTLVSLSLTNGSSPVGTLVQGVDGNLYGATQSGGVYGAGGIFRMSPNNAALTNFYSFTGEADGLRPAAGLARGADANLYGSTVSGGDFGYGTLFKITPEGALTVLYAFTNGLDGSSPAGALVQATDGNFYGMTPGGGAYSQGNIFRLSPAGAFTNLYSFKGGTDGFLPVGALIQATDGNLYGTTKFNKISSYLFYGTIFKVTTNGALTTLYPLNYTDGSHPAAGLVQGGDGNFYGTTYEGGANGEGTLFLITPTGAFTTLVSFDGFADGAHPASALVAGLDGSLYGTTTDGGPGGHGTVFRLSFAPRILSKPANLEVFAGTNVTLSVSVFGTQPLFYQWRQNGINLSDGANISGSATPTLYLSNVSAANAGTYSLLVTNTLGAVTNTGPVLTVISPPLFQALQQTNGTLILTWSAALGHAYQLQYKPDLSSADWLNLGNPITATNNAITISDPIGANSRRFYRAVLLH